MALSSSKNLDKFVVIAKISGVHGVKGHIKVHSFTQPIDSFLSYKSLYWYRDNQWLPMPVIKNSIKMSGKNIVLQLENCNDREVAKDYQFTEIAVKREDLPNLPENEYYWTDLYGLNVYTVFGSVNEPKLLGVVDHMLETGANDVVVINSADNPKKKHLVPYLLDKYVLSIDLQQGKMVVDWDPEF